VILAVIENQLSISLQDQSVGALARLVGIGMPMTCSVEVVETQISIFLHDQIVWSLASAISGGSPCGVI